MAGIEYILKNIDEFCVARVEIKTFVDHTAGV